MTTPRTPHRVVTVSGSMDTPIPALTTFPYLINWGTTQLTMSTGMANPIPAKAPPGLTI